MPIPLQGLSRMEIVAGLTVKILLGWLYGYIYLHYYNGDDTWKLLHASIQETELILRDPGTFFRNEFTPVHSIEIGHGWKEITQLYLNDLQHALLVKSMAIFNLVTRGNYYVNIIIFSAITFFGHYWLFKMLNEQFPGRRKLFFIAIFFFLPAVFWLSGYRIDGLLLFFLSLFLRQFFVPTKMSIRRALLLAIGFGGVLICRAEYCAFLILAGIAYTIALKTKRPLRSFCCVYLAALILFASSAWMLPEGGIPGAVARQQQRFALLNGTRLPLSKLEPSLQSFFEVFPQAFANIFLRPFPWEAKGLLQLVASAEIVLIWVLVVVAIWKRDSDWRLRLRHPVILFLFSVAVPVLLSIGYIVPFPGAIVRYKAIAELMTICCLAALVRWPKLSN